MFKQSGLSTNISYYVSVLSIFVGIYLFSTTEWYWILLVPIMHMFNAVISSGGIHRYVAHNSFNVKPLWHKIIMYYGGVLMMQGSALTTAVTHRSHHKYAATDKDSHIYDWTLFFFKRYNLNAPLSSKLTREMIKFPDVKFTYKYALLIWVAFVIILLSVSWKLFLFGYLIPLGTHNLIVALHFVIAHKTNDKRAVEWPWLELLLPAGGEWMHKTHHDKPRLIDYRTKWYHPDPGYWFLKLIMVKEPKWQRTI